MKKFKLQKQKYGLDKNLLILIFVLLSMGLVFIADASAPQALNQYGDKFFFVKQQLQWAVIGIAALFVFSNVHYSFWEKIATPLFFLSIFLLLIVLLPHFGLKALGARRWISVGFINFQPSEVIKLSMAVYLAKVTSKSKKPLSYFLPLGLVALLIMGQPDLGTTMVVALIGLAQIFVAEVSIYYFLGALLFGGLGVVGLILTSPYRKDRLLTFLQMTNDPLGKSYHIRQVLLALGSGGVFGVGLGSSRQKYLFLPESSTDSIFAVIGEELGLFGGAVLISLFVYFVIRGLKIARGAPDKFSQSLATGITAWIAGQAFLNISAMVALVPLTGIPLPFLSYGGSSLLMILSACGILLNISKNASLEKIKR